MTPRAATDDPIRHSLLSPFQHAKISDHRQTMRQLHEAVTVAVFTLNSRMMQQLKCSRRRKKQNIPLHRHHCNELGFSSSTDRRRRLVCQDGSARRRRLSPACPRCCRATSLPLHQHCSHCCSVSVSVSYFN